MDDPVTDDGLDFDPGLVEVYGGLWFVQPAREFASVEEWCRNVLTVKTPDGPRAVAFTDEDLARRHVEGRQFAEPLAVAHLDWTLTLVLVLLGLLRCGHTTLLLNPVPGGASWPVSVRRLVRRLVMPAP